jgi:hypothetical protein
MKQIHLDYKAKENPLVVEHSEAISSLDQKKIMCRSKLEKEKVSVRSEYSTVVERNEQLRREI